MKTKFKSKLLGVLLVLVMVLALVPVSALTAFAAGGTEFVHFAIEEHCTDVAPEAFVQAAVENNCRVICCSALLTTTMDVMADVVKAAEKAGVREQVKIMVGGAPVTEEFRLAIGADCYAADAASAADAAVMLCECE